MKKAWFAFWRIFEPLKAAIYPYVRWKLPQEVEKDYSPDQAVHFAMNRFWGFIRPSQVIWEITSLAKIAKNLRPETVLEVGTSRGGTLFIWSRLAAKEAHLVSIDLPGGENIWAYPRWKEPLYRRFASKGQRIDLLRGDSQTQEMAERLKKTLDGAQVDFLFIDADHSYEGVKKDYELYSPFVRPGGVIAFHDIAEHPPITNCHVKKLWDEIKTDSRYRYQEFIENAAQGWGGIGVLFVK